MRNTNTHIRRVNEILTQKHITNFTYRKNIVTYDY